MASARKLYPLMVAALVAAALTVAGCSADEVLEEQQIGVITFQPVVNNVTTTRSVTETTTENFNQFDVWAYKNDKEDETLVIGKSPDLGTCIRKTSNFGKVETTKKNSEIWGYDKEREIAFWPSDGTQQLQFYAVSPSTTRSTVNDLKLNITKGGHSFTYKAEDDDHSRQTDIVVAGKLVNLTELTSLTTSSLPSNQYMMVTMNFHHALAQAVFEAKLQGGYSGLKVTVYSIEICNVYRSGTCQITSDGLPSWAADDLTDKYSYTININGTSGQVLSTADGTSGNVTTVLPLSNGTDDGFNDNILLIPQTLTAWNPSSGSLGNSGSYLKIKCDISQNGFDLLKEKYVYVPFGYETATNHNKEAGSQEAGSQWNGKFEAGKKYRFTLEFGLGYDSTGHLNGLPIKFSVTASSWEDKANTFDLKGTTN